MSRIFWQICGNPILAKHQAVSAHRWHLAGADIRTQSGSYGGEKGGEMTVDAGGQHVLERTSILINSKVWHRVMPERLDSIKRR